MPATGHAGRGGFSLTHVLFLVVALTATFDANAWDWHVTEFHYQRGKLAAPAFAGGTRSQTNIYTLQHASGWGFGDVFFFRRLSRRRTC